MSFENIDFTVSDSFEKNSGKFASTILTSCIQESNLFCIPVTASSNDATMGANEKFTRSPTDCLMSPHALEMFVRCCLVSVLASSSEYICRDSITLSTAAPFLSSAPVRSETSMPSLLSWVVVPLYVFINVVIDELRSLPVTLERYTAAFEILSMSSDDFPSAASSATIVSIESLLSRVCLESSDMVPLTLSNASPPPSAISSCLYFLSASSKSEKHP